MTYACEFAMNNYKNPNYVELQTDIVVFFKEHNFCIDTFVSDVDENTHLLLRWPIRPIIHVCYVRHQSISQFPPSYYGMYVRYYHPCLFDSFFLLPPFSKRITPFLPPINVILHFTVSMYIIYCI